MSDRLAVFHLGRVEQVGRPSDVYERPATSFVAEFVGLSNLISGEAAAALTGSKEPFSIRPEKIRMVDPAEPVPPESCAALGRIRDVVYLGAQTRYVVALDTGVSIAVVEPNREASSGEAHALRGRSVRLVWPRSRNRPLGGGA